MGRRILNRKDLRDQNDAFERRKDEDETTTEAEEVDDEEEDGDEEEAEEGDDEAAEEEGDDEEEGGDDDEDEDGAPKKKKKPKAKPKPKVVKPKRTRVAKVTRMRVVWGVFTNSNQCVATYEYPRKAEAEAHAAKLTADKRSTHFLQPVKEPIEEKKEK